MKTETAGEIRRKILRAAAELLAPPINWSAGRSGSYDAGWNDAVAAFRRQLDDLAELQVEPKPVTDHDLACGCDLCVEQREIEALPSAEGVCP